MVSLKKLEGFNFTKVENARFDVHRDYCFVEDFYSAIHHKSEHINVEKYGEYGPDLRPKSRLSLVSHRYWMPKNINFLDPFKKWQSTRSGNKFYIHY